MKSASKTLTRSNRVPLIVPAEKWHTVDTALTALNTETTPIMQPLTNAERNALLGVGSAKESFTRDCLALMGAHPELVPASLGAADAARDWATREQMLARRWQVAALLRRFDDTIAGLESDCCATALAGYQAMVRGGAPAGLEPEVAQLRQHFARYAGPAKAPTAPAGTPPTNVVGIPGAAGNGGTSPATLAA